VLDMSKIEANHFEILPVAFYFKDMVNSAVNVLRFRADEKKQGLIVDIDEKIPPEVIGDDFRLTQIITNLLDNAIKFTPEGGTVSLRTKLLTGKGSPFVVWVEVQDTGIGISDEHKNRLFDAFEQAEGGTARKYGGTGLGLAICKQIVEMMNGTIWVESEPGKGSRFIFTVPLQRNKESLDADSFDSTELKHLEKRGEAGRYNGFCMLLAEDIEINREIITIILEDSDIRIDNAGNGSEAVRLFQDNPHKYNLILMDIQMPEMDGYEATRIIRGTPQGKKIPIIAMTANVFKEDIDACLAAGMDGHLGKPIDTDKLFTMMDKLLGI
jgi:CheY-like chemotaxis protein